MILNLTFFIFVQLLRLSIYVSTQFWFLSYSSKFMLSANWINVNFCAQIINENVENSLPVMIFKSLCY